MEGKKFLSPRGMVLCGALLLAAGALYLALSLLPQGTMAVVEQNGQEVARRELSQKPCTAQLLAILHASLLPSGSSTDEE